MADAQRKLVMQEVLSKPGYEKFPHSEWEFFELSIEEIDASGRLRFAVKQTPARWIEIGRDVMWEDPEIEPFPTLESARERYEERREALAAKGFVHSDMDF